jgi:hypothetical protein
MLVWINGAFGVGKTSVARILARRLPGSFMFDPEQIGSMLRRVVPHESQTGDFQDIPLWRSLTACTSLGLLESLSRPLIVPMTLVNQVYFDEIMGRLRRPGVGLYHFALVASRTTLRRRLTRRLAFPWSTYWALQQINRCVQALEGPSFAKHVRTDGRTVEDIVDEILNQLPLAVKCRSN